MFRIMFVYGAIAGIVIIAVMTFGMMMSSGAGSQLQGYLTMLVVLSLIFIGIKRYRDKELGGVIKSLPALGLGVLFAKNNGEVENAVLSALETGYRKRVPIHQAMANGTRDLFGPFVHEQNCVLVILENLVDFISIWHTEEIRARIDGLVLSPNYQGSLDASRRASRAQSGQEGCFLLEKGLGHGWIKKFFKAHQTKG